MHKTLINPLLKISTTFNRILKIINENFHPERVKPQMQKKKKSSQSTQIRFLQLFFSICLKLCCLMYYMIYLLSLSPSLFVAIQFYRYTNITAQLRIKTFSGASEFLWRKLKICREAGGRTCTHLYVMGRL